MVISSRMLQLFRPQPTTISVAMFLFIVTPFTDGLIRDVGSNVRICGGLFSWISCWRWLRTTTLGGLPMGDVVTDHPITFLFLYPLTCYVMGAIGVATVRHLTQRCVSSNNLP